MSFGEIRSETPMCGSKPITAAPLIENHDVPSLKGSTDPRTANTTTSSSTNFRNPTISTSFNDAKADPRFAKELQNTTSHLLSYHNGTPPSTTSRSSYAALSPLSFIAEMIETEPKRPESDDESGWMYRAMSEVWDGGDRVLRSIRIRAREMNDATRRAVQEFFAPHFTFTNAYANVRLPSTVIKELETKAEEFEQALEQMNDVECVVRASEAGYRLRDAWLRASGNVDDDFIPVLATCLATREDAPIVLLVLSRGYDGNAMLRKSWVTRMMEPRVCALRRMLTRLPTSARRIWRSQKSIVREFDKQLHAYLGRHINLKTGP